MYFMLVCFHYLILVILLSAHLLAKLYTHAHAPLKATIIIVSLFCTCILSSVNIM